MSEMSGGTTPPREQPLATRVVRGSLIVALASYATIIIGFTATIVMARLVAPRDFGTLAIGTFLFGVMNLRAKVGVGQAFARDPQSGGRAFGTLYTLDLGAAAFSLVLALGFAPLLSFFGYDQEVSRVVVALAFISLLEATGASAGLVLDKSLLFGRTTVASAISLALSYVPALFLTVKGFGVWSLVAQLGVQTLISLAAYWWIARRELRELWRVRWTFDRGLAKEYLRFGLVWGGAAVAGFLNTQFDNFLVGTFVGLTVLGFYDRAYRFASWPNLLVTSIIARASFFTYAKLQDDRARLSKTLEMTLWLITTLALPLALVILITAPELITILLGDRWQPTVPFLRILVIYSVIRPLLEDIGGLLIALGKPGLVSLTSWIQTAVLVVVAGALTFLFGAVGTALGVGISFLVGGVVLYRWVVRWVDLSLSRALGLPLIVTAMTLGLYFVVNQWLNLESLPVFISFCSKSALTLAFFYLMLILIQPRIFSERVRYVWRLARGFV
jgi:O-antigen/teichoic acid export membrane protein